jgi:hypothetical protein
MAVLHRRIAGSIRPVRESLIENSLGLENLRKTSLVNEAVDGGERHGLVWKTLTPPNG